MKKILFNYEYEQYGSYNPDTVNLGDYIQFLAAAQYFGRVDEFVDRDHLSTVKEGAIIGNGWYSFSDDRHQLLESSSLQFLPISIHINNPEESFPQVLKSLKRIEPIGCRDLATCAYLRKKNIDAYFSSCLTTTLDIKYSDPEILSGRKQRRGVFLVDVNRGKDFPFNFVKAILGKKKAVLANQVERLLTIYPTEPVFRIQHEVDKSLSHTERFAMAEKLLKSYSHAKLVITSRIHAALPCLALGTPVVLVVKRKDPKRYQGLTEFLNYTWFNSNGELEINIAKNAQGEVVNKDEFKVYADKLKQRCKQFVDSIGLKLPS